MCLPVDFLEDPICVSIILHDLEAHLSDQYLPVQPWRPEMEAGRGGGGGESKQHRSSPGRWGQCWGSSPWTPTPPTVPHPCGLPVWPDAARAPGYQFPGVLGWDKR